MKYQIHQRNLDLFIAAICVALYVVAQILDDVVVQLLHRWNLFSYCCFYSLRFWVVIGLAASFSAIWRLSGSFLLAIFMPLAFGVGTGYLCAWLSQDVSDRWYILHLFSTPGLVGDSITERRVWGIDDWQIGEPWFHRHEIAAWNTLVWTGVTLLFGIPLYYGLRRFNRSHANA